MKIQKLLALLLAAALVLTCLSACGGDSGSSGSSTVSSGSSEESAPDSSSSEDSSETSSEGEKPEGPASDVKNGEVNQQTYPLSTSGETLSYWYPWAGSMTELADFNDSYFFQWNEELTGVHIDFIVPASGSESDAFQLLFASDDMPDMLHTEPASYSYRNGQDAAIDDGYFIDMAQYLEFAPNFNSWLAGNDDFRRAAYSDTGKLYGMWNVWSDMEPGVVYADWGPSIRKDFLDRVKMEVPTTYSEWEAVLTAFKEQLGVEAPFYTSKYGIDTGEFMAGYDTAPYFYQRDGKVQYGPMDDNYKEYLTMLHDWWSKGLLDPDFATRSSGGTTADNDMMLNDKVGSLMDHGTRLGDVYISRGATNPDLMMVAAPQPTKDKDDPTYVEPNWRSATYANSISNSTELIAADSEKIELAIRWLDGFYAKDVALNANYGTEEYEGKVWHYDDSTSTGRLIDYDYRFSNPDGMSSGMVLVQFSMKNPPIRYEGMQSETGPAERKDGYMLWKKYGSGMYLPARLTMTTEEGQTYASMYTDIETYVQECNVKFIMGQMSLDEYDSYRDTLKSMGIEQCIEIQQTALDRYNARSF